MLKSRTIHTAAVNQLGLKFALGLHSVKSDQPVSHSVSSTFTHVL